MLHSHLIVKTCPVAKDENIILWEDYRITLLTDRLFRIEKNASGTFCDDATLAVWYRDMKRVPARVTPGNRSICIKTSKVTLFLDKKFTNSYIRIGRKEVEINNAENLKGTYRTLDEFDGRYFRSSKDHPIHMENGVISKNGVAVYDDTKTPILTQEGMPASRPEEEMDIYVFAYGHDYRGAVKALYSICGKTPLIPRYAFGNWWSRYHAYTDREYLHVLDRLANRDIPLTVATIDMDWHWSTTLDEAKGISKAHKNDAFHGGISGWTGYSWNTDLFPDYKSFLKKVKDRNLKITLNLHPADGVRFFEDFYPQMAEAMGIDPATEQPVYFDITDPKFVNAYFDILHHPYEKDGVDFWWMDWQQGCNTTIQNLDPLWSLNHFHHLDNALTHKPLILSRYAGIGSHRYPLGFSGDTYITWDSLDFLPYFTATASNAGYTWWSHDIGGHMHGYSDSELYTRFVQFGVFSPINRLHCSNASVMTKEPSTYMGGAGLIAEEYLRLRHRMIPYLYSAAYETTDHGRALIEPLYYEYPRESRAYRFPNEYFFGTELLVCPITSPTDSSGLATVKMWLPKGHWTDIFTGDEYDGGRIVTMSRWLESFPALLKEGGLLVLDGRKHTNDTSNPEILDVLVANGTGSYTLHEDDATGKPINTLFKSEKVSDGVQKVEISCQYKGILPRRTYRLEFRNISTGNISVTANGTPMDFTWDDDGYLIVTLPNTANGITYCIEVHYTEKTKLEFLRERAVYSLQRIAFSNDSKGRLYRKLRDAEDLVDYTEAIKESRLSSSAKRRLMENV